MESHDEVLQVLEERFPKAIGDATPFEWLNKVESSIGKGEGSVNAYINVFKGQQAENIAINMLKGKGLNAKLLTH